MCACSAAAVAVDLALIMPRHRREPAVAVAPLEVSSISSSLPACSVRPSPLSSAQEVLAEPHKPRPLLTEILAQAAVLQRSTFSEREAVFLETQELPQRPLVAPTLKASSLDMPRRPHQEAEAVARCLAVVSLVQYQARPLFPLLEAVVERVRRQVHSQQPPEGLEVPRAFRLPTPPALFLLLPVDRQVKQPAPFQLSALLEDSRQQELAAVEVLIVRASQVWPEPPAHSLAVAVAVDLLPTT